MRITNREIEQTEFKTVKGYTFVFYLVILILTIWVLSGYIAYKLFPSWDLRGQFGDMFGAVNALFSGTALVGVVYAILLQRKELELQREDLELTRLELERSASAQENSARDLALQTKLQNNLLNAQLLKDRFDMYWRTYDAVTAIDVDEFKLYPEDYMKIDLYEKRYAHDETAIRRYIYMSQLYEYLAFTHTLPKLGIDDPLGPQWIVLWIKDLISSSEFTDVREQYRGYYPDFEKFVDSISNEIQI